MDMKPPLSDMQRRVYDLVANDKREKVPMAELRDYLDRQGASFDEVFDEELLRHYLNVRPDAPDSPGWAALDTISSG